MSKYDPNIREEELKNRVATDWFDGFDCSPILGNIDFCVALQGQEVDSIFDLESLLWAEAKKGVGNNPIDSLAQLVITIGKARTFDHYLPPPYLGAFDARGIAFIPFHLVQDIFYQNDFNWNVTPSDHTTREFRLVSKHLEQHNISNELVTYDFLRDEVELRHFIRVNFKNVTATPRKRKINKNNFVPIFGKWLETVKPSISINWDEAKVEGLLPADFYLADLISENNKTLRQRLYVLLVSDHYKYDAHINKLGTLQFGEVQFNDNQRAHTEFWNRYERPPRGDYWNYIIDRRDILVPQDIRERRGSFFTPSRWVNLSQEYLADYFGENWQDEYYIWDCCAGTGNLLANLNNAPRIWASTLDQPDVDAMRSIAANKGLNLLEKHIFKFDFLNDSFDNLPDSLKQVINDSEKRKRLIIYINPPYAEAGNVKQLSGHGVNKTNVAVKMKTYEQYKDTIGIAGRELFAQFLIRIYTEIPDAYIAEFLTLKILQAPNFEKFRDVFKAKLEKIFLVPANTFDNVEGKFPIGFYIWNTQIHEIFTEAVGDVYERDGNFLTTKTLRSYAGYKTLTDWMISTRNRPNEMIIGFNQYQGYDFQNASKNRIETTKEQIPHPRGTYVTSCNLIESCIYIAVRHVIEATWLNDRDQFLYPHDSWKDDKQFQSDCLAYTLFNNNIRSQFGANHWIPYTEYEVGAKDSFESHFMSDFIHGKWGASSVVSEPTLFGPRETPKPAIGGTQPIEFSAAAQAVLDAGRELWRYYHQQPEVNVNASFYDIREYFQGRNDKGVMNTDSADVHYMQLLHRLRETLHTLSEQIVPKVYEHGFLLR